MTLKISISGVRGLVPDTLTPEVCLDFAKAFGTYLEGGKVVVGSDPRRSSEFIKGIVFSGLLSAGCRVIDLGICPTPTVGIMLRELKANGGMVITASHNPLPWNGLKFMREDGIFLNAGQANKLINIYENKQFRSGAPKGLSSNRSGIDIHIRKVLKAVNPFAVRRRKFKVAVDGCNGAGSTALPKLLEKLGCKVYPLNCSLKLPFPHAPEPIPENLDELRRLLKDKKADLAFAVDADADRLAVVSEKGDAVGEELTLALAVKFVLSCKAAGGRKKIVVSNLSTSRVIDDICRQFGALSMRTKVGEVHVAEQLKELKGIIGGEGNGGVIFPPVGFNRDSLAAAALILNYLAASRKKISELTEELSRYAMIKTKLECRSLDEAQEITERIKQVFRGKDMILTEGVKVVLPDAWIHVRASNTEPIVRIIAEAKSKEAAEELIRRAAPQLFDPLV